MAKKKVKKNVQSLGKQDDKKLFAFFAAFFTIVGFIIVMILKKEDRYVMFYAKQGLVLFMGWLIAWAVGLMPVIGKFILGPILWILLLILWVITWINALSGEQKKTWLIGDLAEKIKV